MSFTESLPITFLQYCKENQKNRLIPLPERNIMTFLLRDFNYSTDYKTYFELLTNIRDKKYPHLMVINFVNLWSRYVRYTC